MQQIVSGFHASPPMSPEFAPRSSVRAYLVERPAGNVLLYAAETVRAGDPEVAALGGIDRILLSHWHEAMFGAHAIGAPVHVADADRAETEAYGPVAGALDAAATEGIELIPMPGHTPGSTAFMVDLDGTRALFTGDSLWFGPEGWKVAVLPDSDRAAYLESLATLRTLEFDLLVPSFAPRDAAFTERVTPARWRDGVDTLVARIEAGDNF